MVVPLCGRAAVRSCGGRAVVRSCGRAVVRSCGRVRASVSENSFEPIHVVYNYNQIDRRRIANSIITSDLDENSDTRHKTTSTARTCGASSADTAPPSLRISWRTFLCFYRPCTTVAETSVFPGRHTPLLPSMCIGSSGAQGRGHLIIELLVVTSR